MFFVCFVHINKLLYSIVFSERLFINIVLLGFNAFFFYKLNCFTLLNLTTDSFND